MQRSFKSGYKDHYVLSEPFFNRRRVVRTFKTVIVITICILSVLWHFRNYKRPINPARRFVTSSTDTLDSQETRPVDVDLADSKSKGLSEKQTADTAWLCSKNNIHGMSNIKERKILWSKPVGPLARRALYKDLASVEFSKTVDSSCLAYMHIPRIVHDEDPLIKPDEIMFGLASNRDRIIIEQSIPANWLHESNTNLYISLPKGDPKSTETDLIDYFKDLGLNALYTIRDIQDEQAIRYAKFSASMYEMTLRQNLTHIKWFIHLDDDTFVTDVKEYGRMLSKYNSSAELYIGAHSESSSALWRDGRGAWGGASVAVSPPLAAKLSANWDDCEKRFHHTPYGDHKLDSAVAYIQQRPRQNPIITLERSLHQLDLWGTIDGLLRGGQETWLTLHHFGWNDIFPGVPKWDQFSRVALAARYLGTHNLFRNYLLEYNYTQHEDKSISGKATVLTNGFAITEYYTPLTKEDLELVEMTWHDSAAGDYHSALGPFRNTLTEGTDRRTFWLQEVKDRGVDERGNRGSTWLYRNDAGAEVGNLDIVVEWLE